ncbi:MAG: 5'-deoxynucleotidase [Pseudomonadales bacterium]|nr:5'-deoxynucleotidase [Pseudomonadales bacterium]
MHHFFAYLSKLKYILRWGLKRNVEDENVKEHSFDVAVIAHALAIIRNTYFDGDIDADRVALMALYHDATEVLTGDLPGPIKYFNPSIAEAYKSVEKAAEEKLIAMLPLELQDHYGPLLDYSQAERCYAQIVKAADVISAYLKCLQEVDSGNHEFGVAKQRVETMLADINLPEVDYFLEKFVPSFRLTLDELG